MCSGPSQKFTNQSSYPFHTNIPTCQVFNIVRAVRHTFVDIHLIFWVGCLSRHPYVPHILKVMFLPLDGFNQHDRHDAPAVESGLSSGTLLLILALSHLRSYFIECIISYQLQTPESPAEKKVGRAALDSGKFDCALKNPNQHTPYAAIQRPTSFMVSALWP